MENCTINCETANNYNSLSNEEKGTLRQQLIFRLDSNANQNRCRFH